MLGQALPATTDGMRLALKQGLSWSSSAAAWCARASFRLARCHCREPRPIVVVPGGGALADEVRAAQTKLGFGDGAAHRMALLAMDQLAWAVAGLRAGFEVGDTEEALRALACTGPRRGVGALQPRRRPQRHPAIVDRHLGQPRALAWPPSRRRMLLRHQVDRADSVPSSAPSSSPATAWSMKPSPPCSRTQAFPVFLLGRGDQAALPRAFRLQAKPAAAQPSTNANALSRAASPRASKRGGVEVGISSAPSDRDGRKHPLPHRTPRAAEARGRARRHEGRTSTGRCSISA